jgi:hypothetical protein
LDGVEPLLAIAELAGGDWPISARAGCVELYGGRQIEDESAGIRLLADIRDVFGGRDRVTTAALLDGLRDLDESPWGDWFGKPLTTRALSKLLKPFGVKSRTIRVDGETAKGYLCESLEDAWRRYLSPEPGHETSQRHNPHSSAENGESVSVTSDPVLRIANRRKPAPEAGCDGVTDSEAHEAGCAVHDVPVAGCRYCRKAAS